MGRVDCQSNGQDSCRSVPKRRGACVGRPADPDGSGTAPADGDPTGAGHDSRGHRSSRAGARDGTLAMADTGQSMLKHKRIAAIIGVMVLVVASSVVAVLIWPRADEQTDPRTKASPSSAQVAPGASLAGQPNTVLDTLLPGQFDYPEGWEKNPSPTFRSGEFNPAVPPGSATNIGGTPVGCNTIDPVWALRAKGRETSTLYLRDRKKPEREIMIRVVPAADALSTDGASDALKGATRLRTSSPAAVPPGDARSNSMSRTPFKMARKSSLPRNPATCFRQERTAFGSTCPSTSCADCSCTSWPAVPPTETTRQAHSAQLR